MNDRRHNSRKVPRFVSSSLWYHYNKTDENRGECKYCKCTISVAGGSVTNLKRHLVRKHPTVPLKTTDFPHIPPPSRSPETSSTMSTASCQNPRQTSQPTLALLEMNLWVNLIRDQ